MESTSEMETALQFYEAARDNLSLVRVYCYCGNLEKVKKIQTSGSGFCFLYSSESKPKQLRLPITNTQTNGDSKQIRIRLQPREFSSLLLGLTFDWLIGRDEALYNIPKFTHRCQLVA